MAMTTATATGTPALNDWELLEGKAQDVLPGPYAGQVDLLVTSPPYDDLRTFAGVGMAAWDFPAVAAAAVACLKPDGGGVLVWNVADRRAAGETGTAMRQALHFLDTLGLTLWQTLIWEKQNQVFQKSPYRYSDNWEYLFVFCNGWPPAYTDIIVDRPTTIESRQRTSKEQRTMGRKQDGKAAYAGRTRKPAPAHTARTAIWTTAVGGNGNALRPGGEHIDPHSHPAIYPYTLAADIIRSYCPPGGLVLDPMAGSGTTLRAAVDLGRRAVGVEVVPEYAALIRQRMMQPVMLAPAPQPDTDDAGGKVALPTWGAADRLAGMAAPAQAHAPANPPDDAPTPAPAPLPDTDGLHPTAIRCQRADAERAAAYAARRDALLADIAAGESNTGRLAQRYGLSRQSVRDIIRAGAGAGTGK